jgi:hypothetical protein
VRLTPDELKAAVTRAEAGIREADTNAKRNARRNLLTAVERAAAAAKEAGRVYPVTITLLEIDPPIWRRALTPDCTLEELHDVIQRAMGWANAHLYAFKIGKARYVDPGLLDDLIGGPEQKDATATRLSDLMPARAKAVRFRYEYDFGDSWNHIVLVEKILPAEPGQRYPICVKGKMCCPPEDCGGVGGYFDFVKAMADPKHPEHEDLKEWYGDDFDPEAFDIDEVNQMLTEPG